MASKWLIEVKLSSRGCAPHPPTLGQVQGVRGRPQWSSMATPADVTILEMSEGDELNREKAPRGHTD